MRNVLAMLCLALALAGCNKKEADGWSRFRIPEGSHSSSSSLEWTRRDVISFEFEFDSTAVYETADPVNQYDVNKLFGVSDGGLHTRNSARFGWRWVDGHLEVMAFTHLNGVFHFEKICDAEIGRVYSGSISLGKGYSFWCTDGSESHQVSMERWAQAGGSRYYLWPYFGGDESAPHDITVKIRYVR
jgi:hypothetical protein